MSRIVMKFGGTSVADLDRIRNVARHVRREVDAGHEVAVIVSAMAGKTNELVGWAREAAPLHDAREYDAVEIGDRGSAEFHHQTGQGEGFPGKAGFSIAARVGGCNPAVIPGRRAAASPESMTTVLGLVHGPSTTPGIVIMDFPPGLRPAPE